MYAPLRTSVPPSTCLSGVAYATATKVAIEICPRGSPLPRFTECISTATDPKLVGSETMAKRIKVRGRNSANAIGGSLVKMKGRSGVLVHAECSYTHNRLRTMEAQIQEIVSQLGIWRASNPIAGYREIDAAVRDEDRGPRSRNGDCDDAVHRDEKLQW